MDNLEKAERFVDGMEFEDFLNDEKTRYTVICALEIVGEASKKVPSTIRQKKSTSALEGYGRYERQANSWVFWSG